MGEHLLEFFPVLKKMLGGWSMYVIPPGFGFRTKTKGILIWMADGWTWRHLLFSLLNGYTFMYSSAARSTNVLSLPVEHYTTSNSVLFFLTLMNCENKTMHRRAHKKTLLRTHFF